MKISISEINRPDLEDQDYGWIECQAIKLDGVNEGKICKNTVKFSIKNGMGVCPSCGESYEIVL